jgi:hypothetical protein
VRRVFDQPLHGAPAAMLVLGRRGFDRRVHAASRARAAA